MAENKKNEVVKTEKKKLFNIPDEVSIKIPVKKIVKVVAGIGTAAAVIFVGKKVLDNLPEANEDFIEVDDTEILEAEPEEI